MILKRELYDLLPWWSWLRMRTQLHWLRLTGGMSRQLGIKGQATDVLANITLGARPRAIPMPSSHGGKRDELLAAAAICPTKAFSVVESARKIVLSQSSCVLCGLCYFVAPHSLVPQSEAQQAFPPGNEELCDFPWT